MNDTSIHGTWWDSYPYSSTSVCALHPIYINIEALGKLPKDILDEVNQKKKELDKDKLAYEACLAYLHVVGLLIINYPACLHFLLRAS